MDEKEKKVIDLYNKGYYIWEIANEMHMTEYEVVKILGDRVEGVR